MFLRRSTSRKNYFRLASSHRASCTQTRACTEKAPINWTTITYSMKRAAGRISRRTAKASAFFWWRRAASTIPASCRRTRRSSPSVLTWYKRSWLGIRSAAYRWKRRLTHTGWRRRTSSLIRAPCPNTTSLCRSRSQARRRAIRLNLRNFSSIWPNWSHRMKIDGLNIKNMLNLPILKIEKIYLKFDLNEYIFH